MRPTTHPEEPRGHTARPRWSAVLRALREARGVTQDGWAAQLSVSRKTVQRWETGERAPDPGAETAILAYCRARDLFRAYDRGPLAGLDLTVDRLRDLLAEARWRGGGGQPTASAPVSVAAREQSEGSRHAPPRTPPSNLPVRLTSFVGREQEIAAVRRALGETRLLTLTGAGGCGKTRLALRVADELLWAYPHGIWFVELAALADPALVPQTVAAALGLPTTEQQSPVATLTEFVRPRSLLLILDNCEHLVAACADVVETLLRAGPNVEVLATSREPLGVGGEAVWPVPPLALPPAAWESAVTDEQIRRESASPMPDSIHLFVERARLHRPAFALTPQNAAAVAEVCRRLDGIPLALELAAARVAVLSVEQIAARLGDRFRLLTGGGRTALPRQQTLRAALDWSYDLLTAEEQALLRRLSVFAGGFTLEAAEHIGTGDVLDLLTSLVDKSLVLAEDQGGIVRYRLLETVRQYAGEKLAEGGEDAAARDRHVEWYVGLVQAAAEAFRGPREPEWLSRLEQEHENLRAALSWSLSQGTGAPALRLAAGLARFWEMRGHIGEGKRWLEQALAAGGAPPSLRAMGLRGAGVLAYMQGDYATARALVEHSLVLYRELGDGYGIADAQGNLGRTALRHGDYAGARAFLEASLALHAELGHTPGIANVQFTLGVILLRQGDYAAARARFETSLALNRELGNVEGIANALEELATVVGEQGDDGRQAALLDESLALYRRLGDRSGIASVLGHRGTGAWTRGEYDRAQALLEESLALYREVGDRRGVARLLGNQSLVALSQGDYERAVALCRESLALYREAGDSWAIGKYLPVLAGVAFAQRQPERAARLFGAAVVLRERLGTPLPPVVQPTHDRTVAAVRAGLDGRNFAAAWAEGQAMAWTVAVNYALSDEEAPEQLLAPR